MIRRHFFPLLLAALLPACSEKPAGGSSGAASAKPLRVGMDMTYAPFEFKNAQGEPDGVDVKMAEALAAKLGRPLKLEALPFEGLIPSLQTGEIDLAISAMTATAERAESIDFSEPYAHTGLAILVPADSTVTGIEDLKKPGVRITAKLGTTGESWTKKNLPGATVTALDNEVSCVMEVAQKRVDAFLYDQLSIFAYQRENAATTKALLRPFVEEAWAIGLKKGNDTLRGEVNAFLEEFRESGGLTKLGETYLKEEKKLLDEMGIPFILR